MDISAAVFVGLEREEIGNQDLIHSGRLSICPPRYDGEVESYAIAGFKLLNAVSPMELVLDEEKIQHLKAEFKVLTGQDAKVWLTPRVD